MELNHIDHGMAFDFGRASEDYAKYRDIYPASFYAKLRKFSIGLPGQHVLDLGTGTGVLPRGIYAQKLEFQALTGVEPNLRFTGVDISPNQIEMARALSRGMPIDYLVCPAEEIDFPPETFDAVTACQCFFYFDREVLMPKLHQALKPGGRFAILSMFWLPKESEIVSQSEQLVLKYNPEWTGGGLRRKNKIEQKRSTKMKWARPQLKTEHRFFYCEDLPFTRESWHGRMLACRGIGASSLSAEKIAAFEADHLRYLETLPEKFTIPHQMMMLILRKV